MVPHRSLYAAATLLLTASSVLAQHPVQVPKVPDVKLASPGGRAGPIRLNVEVASKNGLPVSGLSQADFSLMDNKAPRPITGFRELSRSKEPVQVFLILDAVNAGFQTMAYSRNSVERYLSAGNGELPVPFSIGFLTDQGVRLQPESSRDGKALSQAIEANAPGLRQLNRSTGFWGANERLQISLDGVHRAIQYVARQPGRKLLIWISPGWPLLSGPRISLDRKQQEQIFSTVAAFSTLMRESNVTVYSLDPLGPGEPLARVDYYENFLRGVGKPSQTDLADLSVQVLALQSGGQVLNSTDLGGAIQRFLADTDAWYELTLDPPPAEHANEYHHVDVRVDKPGLVVRTRDGYYNQP